MEFGTLTYKAEGVYEYTISEVSGSAEGVTYDTHEYGVTVTVTDDGDHSGQGIGVVAVLGAAAVACGVVVRKVTKRQ